MLVFRMSWAGSVEFAEAAVFWPATEPDLVSTEPQSGELVMYFWDSQRMIDQSCPVPIQALAHFAQF